MKIKILYIAGLLLFFFFLLSCDDDDEKSVSIVGVWSGTNIDFSIDPDGVIPAFTVSQDSFPVTLTFNSDGTLLLTDNNQTSTQGTYSVSGKNLVININYAIEFIGLSGTYTIEELTQSDLRISIGKEGNYEHPDTGQQFNGTVEATLYFDRKTN